ncbi:aminotransferase class V-fold PLP-dependent enzyme [Microbacterium sp. 1P10UB]|uniref:aminotransferase class V-fold PLP-dependent enzyme n=1 Tax=unclassified Microbacterium TaxID=2609290 RepID=UPI00399F604C
MPAALVADPVLDVGREAFTGGRDYLAACTLGLPPTAAVEGMRVHLDAWAAGRPDPVAYTAAVERSRGLYAGLVGVDPARVAIGSQTSVYAALVAASLPDGAEVLCAEGDFSSLVVPFVRAGRGITVRTAPLTDLAASVRADTALVAFSLVQSATGDVADADAIARAAASVGAPTFCDVTQAVGWMPVDAAMFDMTVCHTYKWLCAPRGVAFFTASPGVVASTRPIFAGWYAGDDPWTSCYGGDVELAPDARRFDVSPAWQAFLGAEPALALFASLDAGAVFAHTTSLAERFRRGRGMDAAARPSAIVTWTDPTGCDLARLAAAGITASGRAGRARVAFHVFNDAADVDRALRALGV